MLEVLDAIEDRAADDGRGDELVIWFCCFANYQCEDGAGPTISEQLARDPFGTVIKSPALRCMCLLVTSTQDPYDRLWCAAAIPSIEATGIANIEAHTCSPLCSLRRVYDACARTGACTSSTRRST